MFFSFLLCVISLLCLFIADRSFVEASKGSTVAEIPADVEVKPAPDGIASSPAGQQSHDLTTTSDTEVLREPTAEKARDIDVLVPAAPEVSAGEVIEGDSAAAAVPITDIDSELSCPGATPEPLGISAAQAETSTPPKITYETVEGEPRTTTSETENRETSDDGRTILRRVKTIRYYQPTIRRTLADGVVVGEATEDVLVGSYVDEYCFDSPVDVVDIYSASVETQTSVDETEQTLDDGTWLRRKVTNVVAYLAVDEEETDSVRDVGAEPKIGEEIGHDPQADLKHDEDRHDRVAKMDDGLQPSATDRGLESKDSTTDEAERASEQVAVESVEKPVATVLQPDAELTQHAQLESPTISVPAAEQLVDSADMACKVEPASIIIEAEPHDEQIPAVPVTPSESVLQPDTEHAPHAQLESLSASAPAVEHSADLTCKIEPSSIIIEAEPHAEQITSMPITLSESVLQPDTEHVPAPAVEHSPDLICKIEPSSVIIEAEPHDEQIAAIPITPSESVLQPDTELVPATEQSADSCDLTCKVEPSVVVEALPPDEQTPAIPMTLSETVLQPDTEHVPAPAVEHSAALTCKIEPSSVIIEAEPRDEQIPAIRITPSENVLQPDTEFVPATEQSADSSDLTCKVEPSVVVEAEPEYETEHAAVLPHDEQITTKPMTESEGSTTTESTAASVQYTESPEELLSVVEELIEAVPNPRQERARPTMTAVPITSSFDEPDEFLPGEQLIEEQQAVGQFAAPPCDREPVSEETITPNLRPLKGSAIDTAKLDSTTEKTVFEPVNMHETKKTEQTDVHYVPPPITTKRVDDEMANAKLDSTTNTFGEAEAVPAMEEVIVATPNPRQERSRPIMTSAPVTSSFDEQEILPDEQFITEEQTAEQFAAPVCDLKPVEEAVIAPIVRPPKDLTKRLEQSMEEPVTESLPQTKLMVVEGSEDKMSIALESQLANEQQHTADFVQSETAAVDEELIVAVPNPRQERSRPMIASAPLTSSSDEPEELIQECQTVEQFAAPVCDQNPVEEDVIAPVVKPLRDTVTLDPGIMVRDVPDKTAFAPDEKVKATAEAVQPQATSMDSKAAAVAEQQRTEPVLVLKSESDTKPATVASSTFVPTLPPMSFSRQPRRPRSASETLYRRYGMESPQPGIYSKPRTRRESPLSFFDRLAHPASPPIPFGLEDFDSPVFDETPRQVRTCTKKLITRKVRKVRHDGEVVEDVVTEEVPDYGYSDTSSARSGQSPAAVSRDFMSPRTLSASSMTSPLPIEPVSPGGESLSSQSSLRVFTDTVEGEPEVVTDVQEREETLPDGRVVVRKIIRTRQKQTIVKRTVMEGPPADDSQPTEDGGQLVVVGEDSQKPDIRTYSDSMDMKPSTETVSGDVEEVLPDGTVARKLTTTTSTRQLKTERTVVEGPYVPETVNQAFQGEVLRPGETAMLPQPASPSSASRPAITSAQSRRSPRPKFRIAMESPTPPQTAAEKGGTAARKTSDPSKPADHPRSENDRQSHQPT